MAMEWRVSVVALEVAMAGTNGEPFGCCERPGVGTMVLVKQQVERETDKSSTLPENQQRSY